MENVFIYERTKIIQRGTFIMMANVAGFISWNIISEVLPSINAIYSAYQLGYVACGIMPFFLVGVPFALMTLQEKQERLKKDY